MWSKICTPPSGLAFTGGAFGLKRGPETVSIQFSCAQKPALGPLGASSRLWPDQEGRPRGLGEPTNDLRGAHTCSANPLLLQ